MSGPVAILGGQEHLPGCEPVDRRLLSECGLRRRAVTVLLAATVPGRIHAKVAEVKAYWPRLGAHVRVVAPGGSGVTEQTLAALASPDLVVLTGGRPWRLQRHLTPAVQARLLALHEQGVPVSGSSAGAMALCAWRLDLRPDAVPRMAPGLGLVPGAVAPHFGRHATHHVSRVVAQRHPAVPIVGLPDRTALFGRDGAYEVVGAGACTVLRARHRQRYRNGATVRLGQVSPTRSAVDHLHDGMVEPELADALGAI